MNTIYSYLVAYFPEGVSRKLSVPASRRSFVKLVGRVSGDAYLYEVLAPNQNEIWNLMFGANPKECGSYEIVGRDVVTTPAEILEAKGAVKKLMAGWER